MQIAIYTKSESGALTRNLIDGFESVADLREHYNLGGDGEPEKLVGWPESWVIWYGNTGIAQ